MAEASIPPAEIQWARLAIGARDMGPADELRAKLEASHQKQEPLVVKAGFDPTAPDLHLGHTVLMQKMAQFAALGHDVVFLVGDYTARIGDPTGRNSMRPPLSPEEIDQNAKTYTQQMARVLGEARVRTEWNAQWLSTLSFADIISLAAKYNLGRMLERRDFRERFEANKQIALHEFLYPLMQGYDSVALKADVELGGHDQIFNLNLGRHLMTAYGLAPQCVLTVELLVGTDGVDKMSKSKGNHIGVTDEPRTMFGKVMSIADDTMWTWYPLLFAETPSQDDPLGAKKALAHRVTARFHDTATADAVRDWWDAGRPPDAESHEVSERVLYRVIVATGHAQSNGDARRKIQQGGVSVDDARVADPQTELAPGRHLLRVGKKARLFVDIR